MDFVLRPRVGQFEPNADVFLDEASGRIVVKVELAGADPDRVRVEVRERSLVISGVRRDDTRERVGSLVQKEIAYGDYSKEIHLPVAVRFEKIVAEYADGILVIALPTSETHYVPTTRTAIAMIVKRTLA